jgi:hypothetical protein
MTTDLYSTVIHAHCVYICTLYRHAAHRGELFSARAEKLQHAHDKKGSAKPLGAAGATGGDVSVTGISVTVICNCYAVERSPYRTRLPCSCYAVLYALELHAATSTRSLCYFCVLCYASQSYICTNMLISYSHDLLIRCTMLHAHAHRATSSMSCAAQTASLPVRLTCLVMPWRRMRAS